MNIMMRYAKHYRDALGYSVIPVGKDKKPLVKSWLEYQKRRATDEELASWWSEEGAQIGIVTGRISNLSVVDIDQPDGEKLLLGISPDIASGIVVLTPRGGKHLYFAYAEGIRNRAGAIPGTDLRGEGGYVVAPPSVGMNGKRYDWVDGLPFTELPKLPPKYIEAVESAVPVGTSVIPTLVEGRRDEDLFHLAHTLIKGGMNPEEATVYVSIAAKHCTPPMSAIDAAAKVKSAVERGIRKERNISKEIEDFVRVTEGYFNVKDIYGMLQIVTKEDKALTRVVLHRLVQAGEIERDGKKDGVYRRIMRDIVPIILKAPTDPPIDIALPFGLEELVHIYPGNIIVVAGAPDSGKTAFCLDLIEKNHNKLPIHYFNSEMGDTELCTRLSLHKDTPMDAWKFCAYERSEHYDDVIVPDAINIIDFLEISDNFYKVADEISSIHRKLIGGKGIAVICLQKNRGTDMGRGGTFSMEKPRLYLAMDPGRIKIVKAKNWVYAHRNPNSLIKEFKLLAGATFIETSDWHKENELPRRIFS